MKRGDIGEYVEALRQSPKFGPQVVYHRKGRRRSGSYREMPGLCRQLVDLLAKRGIERLYTHQNSAIEHIRKKEDVLVATPTASGKSLIYNLPVLDDFCRGKKGHALYLFPLKALAQDQRGELEAMYDELCRIEKRSEGQPEFSAIFDGDSTSSQRKKIREQPPPVVMTNPEMLHLSLLPYHEGWAEFFSSLDYVVLDEVHSYRGVLGSHMAWVLRRLQRITTHYGAAPVFILLSATVGNPAELGGQLLGRTPQVVTESGAPAAEKDMLFLNPWDSAAHTASQLLEASIKRELRTIVYTRSRKMTELISLWTAPRLGRYGSRVSAYRAGFLPEERREIESKLTSGELLGVISTSALELGIDIGTLDLCILVGYPGSIIATWQRGGRVGRAMRPSAIVLIAQEDALDQYFMRNPEDFFARKPEDAILNPENETIRSQHLLCAAAELPLEWEEALLCRQGVREAVDALTVEGGLLNTATGRQWLSSRRYPHRYLSLRGGGSRLAIIDGERGEVIGDIDSARVCRECHPGAIYLHRGQSWQVIALELSDAEVVVRAEAAKYHTLPLAEKKTEILEIFASKQCFGLDVFFGRVRVTERVTGYQKKQNHTGRLLSTVTLELPEQSMETTGVWLNIPPALVVKMEKEKRHFMGAIHAMEHGMIALFPLLVLCDRSDIGGISTPLHPQTERASIFVYDGYPGGIGLAAAAYDKMELLLPQTLETIAVCDCETGCPSCVHSPKCGSGNRPIDKGACLFLLEEIVAGKYRECCTRAENLPSVQTDAARGKPGQRPHPIPFLPQEGSGIELLPEVFGVFDLETIRSAQEVGGWNHAEKMGMSVGVVYDSRLDDYVTYLEPEVQRLVAHLQEFDIVVGFNNKRFDNRVLAGYSAENLHALPNLDLLEEVQNQLGYRLKLDTLASATLGVGKSGDGLDALRWYKEGRMDLIRKYCRKDVEITRMLFLHALEHGFLLFRNKGGQTVRLPLQLDRTITRLLAK